MNVKQLIERLQKLPPLHRVIVDKGNGEGSPLDSLEVGHYDPDTTWSGSLKHPDDVEPIHESVVVLSPVN